MSRFTLSLVLVLLLAFLALSVVAQDEEPTEEAPVVDVVPVEEGTVIETPAGDVVVAPDASELDSRVQIQFAAFVAVVLTAIWNLIYIPIASPLVELLTSVTKRVPILKDYSSPSITFFFSVLAWIAFVVMTQLGFGDRFDSLITGLATLASAIFGVPVTQAAASSLHAYAQKHKVPVLGYSRTPSASRAVATLIEKAIEEALGKGLTPAAVAVSSSGEKVPLAEAASDYAHRN